MCPPTRPESGQTCPCRLALPPPAVGGEQLRAEIAEDFLILFYFLHSLLSVAPLPPPLAPPVFVFPSPAEAPIVWYEMEILSATRSPSP